MEFNRQYFVADILSSDTLISGEQNLIKIYVSDLISNTEIANVFITLATGSRTPVAVVGKTLMDFDGKFYSLSFVPTVTVGSSLNLLIEVVDTFGNTYPMEKNIQILVRSSV